MKEIRSFKSLRDCRSYYIQVYKDTEYFFSKRYKYELGFYSKLENKLYFNKKYNGLYNNVKKDIMKMRKWVNILIYENEI